jgi:hypothetical protein
MSTSQPYTRAIFENRPDMNFSDPFFAYTDVIKIKCAGKLYIYTKVVKTNGGRKVKFSARLLMTQLSFNYLPENILGNLCRITAASQLNNTTTEFSIRLLRSGQYKLLPNLPHIDCVRLCAHMLTMNKSSIMRLSAF